MSFTDIKEFNHCILEDSETIAFFKNEEDAEAFLEWKKQQPNPNENDYELGEYIDTDVSIYVRGS